MRHETCWARGVLIPYVHIKDLHVGPLALHPFGILVAAGVLVGVALATRRAKHVGVDATMLQSFVTWMLVAGFVGGHVLDAVFYHPAEVVARPWSLLFLWEGLSSFGGFIGAFVGVLLWKFYELKPVFRVGSALTLSLPTRRATPVSILPFCDLILAVFPVAWAFGRTGCSVVHDHPGARAPMKSILAVAYGEGPSAVYGFLELRHGAAPRYDLGFLELLFTLVLAAAFALTWRRRLPVGTYVVATALAYAPVRFGLDFLRVEDGAGGDPRYGSLTPAQWACLALFAIGVGLWRHLRVASNRNAPEEHALN